jgi:predicted small integral membrane protein
MATTFPGDTVGRRSAHDLVLRRAAFGLILVGESLFAAAHTIGAAALIGTRHTGHPASQPGRQLLIGTVFGFVVWLLCFMLIDGDWVAIWQSHPWNPQWAAFRFYATLLAAGAIIALRRRQPAG